MFTWRSALGTPPMYAIHRWSGDHMLPPAMRSGRSTDVCGVPSARLIRSWHADGEQRIDEIMLPSGDQLASVIGSTESSSNWREPSAIEKLRIRRESPRSENSSVEPFIHPSA